MTLGLALLIIAVVFYVIGLGGLALVIAVIGGILLIVEHRPPRRR